MNDSQPLAPRDPDVFDVRASLRSLSEATRHHGRLVLLTVLMTLGLVTLYVVVWPPVYVASSMLMVERDTDPVRDTFYIGWNVFRKDDARTEIELMTSAPILAQVVDREKLTYADVYHPFMSHLAWIWQSSAVGKAYRRIKTALVGTDPDAPSAAELERIRTIVDLKSGIEIDPIGESNVGRLTVKGPSRKVASIANTLMDVYLASRSDRYQDEARRSYAILHKEAEQAAGDLQAAENRRLDFARTNGLTLDLQKDSLELAKLVNLEEQIAAARSRIATLEATLAELDRQLAVEPPMRTTTTVYELNAQREAAKAKRLELQTALIATQSRYRDDSPEVADIRASLERLDALIAETSEKVAKQTSESLNALRQELESKRGGAESELIGLRAGLAVMEQTAGRLRTRLASVPELQTRLKELDRDRTMAQEKYQQLMAKEAQAAVSVATSRAAMASMRIVETAAPPSEKSWPKYLILYPAALVLSLMLGVLAALVASHASGRVRRETLEGRQGDLAVYGRVGTIRRARPFAVVGPSAARDAAD